MKRTFVPQSVLVAVIFSAAFHGAIVAACSAEPDPTLRVSFHREVVNLENYAGHLVRVPPDEVRHAPPVQGDVWYGEIFRQLPGDDITSREHNVPFAVQFEGSSVVRVWCDANFNGDLSDDPAPTLSLFPGEPPARSFLAPLRWNARSRGRNIPIDQLVRVVVEQPESTEALHLYRTQNVYGMLGTVNVEGAPRSVLLYDSNGDGLYSKGTSDGVFFDLDDDRHFTIDVMAPDYGPFAIPFSVSHSNFAVDSVDIEGKAITLRYLGASAEAQAPTPGLPAPEFALTDSKGRPVRLSSERGRVAIVYFWASWCASCRGQADALRALYERYDRSQLEILGVCYDTDRGAMERFLSEYRHTWPTSFTGGQPAQDPVGRLYREAGAGVFYIVAPDGRLTAREFQVGEVESQLAKLLPQRSGPVGSRP
jgi:thiol-disulfide isomerase/thioredoxin